MKLLLARHGETDWNAAGKIQGQTDIPLNDRGREQAMALGRRLLEEGVSLRALYTSPQKRAFETARIAGAPQGLTPQPLEALREINLGLWEGHSWEEVAARWPEEYAAYDRDRMNVSPTEGESYRQMLRRVVPALKDIERRGEGTALVVAHSAVIRGVLCGLRTEWTHIFPDICPGNADWLLCPPLPDDLKL